MLNDIVTNDRKSIVEFGSGMSTIMIGRLIKNNGLDSRLVTVEHDKGWVDVLAGILRKESIHDVIDNRHFLVESEVHFRILTKLKLFNITTLAY